VAPGRVSFHGRPGVLSDDGHALRWPELLARLPGSVSAEIAVDLVLLVELGGSADAVDGRVALATDVVSKLHHTDIRVAVAGYRDHFHIHHTNAATTRESLVVGCGLGEVSRARSALARGGWWQAVEVRDDYAAPLEDALDWVERGSDWRPDARHLLVVLGSRPPHPGDVDDPANPRAAVCPHHLPWRDILSGLRREHILECVVVHHEETAQQRADEDKDHAWQEFCAEGSFSPVETTSADELMAAIGLAADDNGSPLCLAVRADGSSSQHRRAGSA
jgi:hypothetical protein